MLNHPLRDIGVEKFLAEYWQKKPLLIRQAFPNYQSPLSGDELAGLSCEQGIESRIVYKEKDGKPWQLETGPFEESIFAQLPENDWTLLVQGVDSWNTELAELLDNFRFLPNWLLDDIMASFSPPGGSVGPHFDEYDVFLLQAEGTREWKTGQICNHATSCLDSTPLRIVENFQESDQWILEPGDMLYLPPRLAHYGTAITAGITLSIGFRSPSFEEIIDGVTQTVLDDLPIGDHLKTVHISHIQNPGVIPKKVIHEIQKIVHKKITEDAIAKWFGSYSTTLKFDASEQNEVNCCDIEDILADLSEYPHLTRSEETRICYYNDDTNITLFVNGESFILNAGHLSIVELLCTKRKVKSSELLKKIEQCNLTQHEALTLIQELINKGSYYFD